MNDVTGVRNRVLGEQDPDTLDSRNDLAEVYRCQGKFAQAESLVVKGLEITRRVRGEEDSRTLTNMNNLAVLYLDQGRYADAEPLLAKVLEVYRRDPAEEAPSRSPP
jgi:tetratricopeptide (TPR) repeat protein